jgi:hypothetical protein
MMDSTSVGGKASRNSQFWPVLNEAERDAVVARARVELFKLVPNVSEADWPFLEMGIQVRINVTPELQRRFWSEPEKVVVEALQDFAKWAETNETWQRLTGEIKNA